MVCRIKALFLCFIVASLLAFARLVYIQIFSFDYLCDTASIQQKIPIVDRRLVGDCKDSDALYYLINRDKADGELENIMEKIEGVYGGFKGENYLVYKVNRFRERFHDILINDYDAYAFFVPVNGNTDYFVYGNGAGQIVKGIGLVD